MLAERGSERLMISLIRGLRARHSHAAHLPMEAQCARQAMQLHAAAYEKPVFRAKGEPGNRERLYSKTDVGGKLVARRTANLDSLDCDFSLAKSIEEMIPEGRREILPLNSRHLFPKCQAGQFLLDAPLLCSISRSTQLVCQFKEPALLSFLRLQPGLDELNENPVFSSVIARQVRRLTVFEAALVDVSVS